MWRRNDKKPATTDTMSWPRRSIGQEPAPKRDGAAPLLEVSELRTHFATDDGEFRAVDGVSFTLLAGRTLGVVGESGCGKSVTAHSIMGLVPMPPGRIAGGAVRFEGTDLIGLPAAQLRELRGNKVSMIFQEPMTSLNPALTIGDQIVEVILRHRAVTPHEARERAIEMLRRVRIPAPEQRFREYPHKLSGGTRQRVMIAMALACDPKLLIADEPTTALDVTVQAQILDLMRNLRDETGTAIILITHDLGVIAELAQEVIVMYAGRVVERGEVTTLFAAPQHPYTVGLLGSKPKLSSEQDRLATIEGMAPSPLDLPQGCRFHPRCPFAIDACRASEPPLAEVKPRHFSACWRAPLEENVL
jgi:peptide/nickel transport system ATP-binding protein